MQDKEKEIVNDDFVKNKQTYNMTKGGEGSWSHIDSSGENNPMHKRKKCRNRQKNGLKICQL